MDLNPQRSLEQLEDAYKAYLNAPAGRREALAVDLRRSISRAEIEVGNLSRHADADVDQRLLYKKLLGTVELAKASLPQ